MGKVIRSFKDTTPRGHWNSILREVYATGVSLENMVTHYSDYVSHQHLSMLTLDPADVHGGHYPLGPVLGSAVQSQFWDTPIKLGSQQLKVYVVMLFHLAMNNFLELTHCVRALLTSLPATAQQKDEIIQPQAISNHTVLPNF